MFFARNPAVGWFEVRTGLSGVAMLVSLGAVLPMTASADVWLFEPSLGIDQRFDDNYLLDDATDGSLSAARVFAELKGSREGRASAYRAEARIDQQITSGDGQVEGADSDRSLEFDAVFRAERLRYGANFGYLKGSTARDIATDLTDKEGTNEDVRLTDPQGADVGQKQYTFEPNIEFDLSRRALLKASLKYKQIEHDLPYPRDAISAQYEAIRANAINNGEDPGPAIPFDELTIGDVGNVFSPSNERDDSSEVNLELSTRFKASEVVTFTGTIGYKDFRGEDEPDPFAIIPFEELVSDPDLRDIRRKPKRDSLSKTTTLKLGFERSLSPILKFGVEGGIYRTEIDKTDLLRSSDRPGEDIPAERLNSLITEDDGWLANLTFTRDDGVLRLVGKYVVDVKTSTGGSLVESAELTGDASWILNPRTTVSLRARGYEPRSIDGDEVQAVLPVPDTESRRLISIEPRISWQYSRAWTVSAAYRYRRQRFRLSDFSSDSNAILFTLRYTPPSALRAAADSEGF